MCNFVKNLFVLCFVRTVAWMVRSSIKGRTKFIHKKGRPEKQELLKEEDNVAVQRCWLLWGKVGLKAKTAFRSFLSAP